ncbi:ubiquitin-like domain-containing protein [Tersicoccus sp. Bi-70]|uniref:ubiquitin-like domain-containing protein n=1 Tax=Tersicoccus sp. Bi-70 TaxID=1897634 RepID=UPI0009789859|nr:ubiquitin-like domain-containing protein [Tersicoccus sp. Bi-70]OMH31390.1 hypothetical protein BGP79_10275 [Tersicoccus sp. Bi-70]
MTTRPTLRRRRQRRIAGFLAGAVLVSVLAVAGAVGLAVASPARTVTITVIDGAARPTTTAVQADAGRVGDVLAQAGVTAGAQDDVDPGLDEQVGDDDAIRITRAKELDLVIDGRPRHLTTPLRTVGELIHSLALPAGTRAAVPDDRDLTTAPHPLAIATPKRITITVDGRTSTVRTAAPTVRQAVTEQGIRIGARDQVTPDAGSVPTAQLRITVTRIGTGPTVKERESVPYSTEVRQDPTRYAGETVVLRDGVPGEIVRSFATRTVDGQPRGRVLVGSTTVRQPVSRIVSVGTLDRPGQAPPESDGGAAVPGTGSLPADPAPAPAAPATAAPAPAPQPSSSMPDPTDPTQPDPTQPGPTQPEQTSDARLPQAEGSPLPSASSPAPSASTSSTDAPAAGPQPATGNATGGSASSSTVLPSAPAPVVGGDPSGVLSGVGTATRSALLSGGLA